MSTAPNDGPLFRKLLSDAEQAFIEELGLLIIGTSDGAPDNNKIDRLIGDQMERYTPQNTAALVELVNDTWSLLFEDCENIVSDAYQWLILVIEHRIEQHLLEARDAFLEGYRSTDEEEQDDATASDA